MVQPFYKILGSSLKKLKIVLSYGPTIPSLGIYLEKMKILIQKHIHPFMFAAGQLLSRTLLFVTSWTVAH